MCIRDSPCPPDPVDRRVSFGADRIGGRRTTAEAAGYSCRRKYGDLPGRGRGPAPVRRLLPVSYTHLDVYKRQVRTSAFPGGPPAAALAHACPAREVIENVPVS